MAIPCLIHPPLAKVTYQNGQISGQKFDLAAVDTRDIIPRSSPCAAAS